MRFQCSVFKLPLEDRKGSKARNKVPPNLRIGNWIFSFFRFQVSAFSLSSPHQFSTISAIPFRTIMTAMEASRRLAILESVRVPA
jgi:hypothetical protein